MSHALPAPPAASAAVSPQFAELAALRVQAHTARRRGRGGVGLGSGHHVSRATGRGLDFAELRPYQPGDDPRTLDWRHTARRGRPFTKLFHEERERPVLLLVDLGPSMHFGTRGVFKCVQAARAAALLGWSACDGGDRVGGIVRTPHGLARLPTRRGEAGALTLLHALCAPPPASPAAPRLTDALRALVSMQHRGCEVIVISDFLTLDHDVERAMQPLRGAGSVTLLRIADPLEQAPPPAGLYPVMESAGVSWLDLRAPGTREAYRAACKAREARLGEVARGLKARWLTLSSANTPLDALDAWAHRA